MEVTTTSLGPISSVRSSGPLPAHSSAPRLVLPQLLLQGAHLTVPRPPSPAQKFPGGGPPRRPGTDMTPKENNVTLTGGHYTQHPFLSAESRSLSAPGLVQLQRWPTRSQTQRRPESGPGVPGARLLRAEPASRFPPASASPRGLVPRNREEGNAVLEGIVFVIPFPCGELPPECLPLGAEGLNSLLEQRPGCSVGSESCQQCPARAVP